MQEYKTLLDLVRFIAGATKVLENIVGTISIRVPGGTRINLNLMEWHVLDCLARHEKQASQKEKPSELLQSLVSAAETPRSSALSCG